MAEIIRRVNSAPGTPSGIKSYLSSTKTLCPLLKDIAPLHAGGYVHPSHLNRLRRRRGSRSREKWEGELEETIDGWVALSSRESEVSRKRGDM